MGVKIGRGEATHQERLMWVQAPDMTTAQDLARKLEGGKVEGVRIQITAVSGGNEYRVWWLS